MSYITIIALFVILSMITIVSGLLRDAADAVWSEAIAISEGYDAFINGKEPEYLSENVAWNRFVTNDLWYRPLYPEYCYGDWPDISIAAQRQNSKTLCLKTVA